jgi:hypothetical protein
MATLFEQIEREDIANRLELNKRQQLHLPLIDAFCQANDPYEIRAQLIGANGVASLGLENSQASELPEPFIRCRTGFMEESSRFNYGYDMAINKRKIDVSGQLIPNEELRSMPQRGVQIHAYQTTRILPYKTNIAKLAEELSNTIVDNRFNIKNVSSSARYKITNPGVNYRSLYQTDKNKATYQTPPGDMKPAPYIKTEPGTFP